MIFADTSALFASLDGNDKRSEKARAVFEDILSKSERFVTTNYVVVELIALVQRRLGMPAAQEAIQVLIPELTVSFVDRSLHEAGVALLLSEPRRHLSLIDCTSIAFMRRTGITRAFAYDADFDHFGITSVC